MDGSELQLVRLTQDRLHRDSSLLSTSETKMRIHRNQSFSQREQEQKTFGIFNNEGFAIEEVLLKKAKNICERYKVQFSHLTLIQRKFITHYRCEQCGLLPLYYLDLLHVKRVRCKECGQLISFKKKGKYGKLRKEIAFELMKEIQGGITRLEQQQ